MISSLGKKGLHTGPKCNALRVIFIKSGGIGNFLLGFTTQNLPKKLGENTSYWRKNVMGFDDLRSKLLKMTSLRISGVKKIKGRFST